MTSIADTQSLLLATNAAPLERLYGPFAGEAVAQPQAFCAVVHRPATDRNGEFGGGLSDDGDLTNVWPSAALMGCEPTRSRSPCGAARRLYQQECSPTACRQFKPMTHSYEESRCWVRHYFWIMAIRSSERAMETHAPSIASPELTKPVTAMFVHLLAARMAEEPWGWARSSSYLLTQPVCCWSITTAVRRLRIMLELADGLLATGKMRTAATGSLPQSALTRSGSKHADRSDLADRFGPRGVGPATYRSRCETSPRILDVINADASIN